MLITGNILKLFSDINDYYSPKVIAELNDEYIKLAKFKGELIWHHHEQEDELFYVVKGSFELHLEDQIVSLSEGDFYVVKKGIRHKPVAKETCLVMLIEKKETKHTGEVVSSITKSIEDQIG